MIATLQIERYLEENLDKYLAILEEMVSINSFTANSAGVNETGRLTAKIFADMGFQPEFIESSNPIHGNHLILTRSVNAETKFPTIGLISHLDTVFTRDEERRNDFSWRVRGDRIYGPGTVDIKGGTLLIYMLLDSIKVIYPRYFEETNWVILLNAAEETLDLDFGSVCRSKLPEDSLACLVFEAGKKIRNNFTLVTARKGMATFRIEVFGRAAHAGSSHRDGANAIVQIAQTIGEVAALTDYSDEITFNLGTVAGGTVINRVPHYAVAEGEMRAFTPENMRNGMERLLELQNEAVISSSNDGFSCQVNIEILNQWSPWPINDSTQALFEIWRLAASELGFQLDSQQRGGLSDGNLTWDFVPTLDGLGPSGGNAHCSERREDGSKDQEYLEISSLIPKTRLNVRAIMLLLRMNQSEEELSPSV